MNPEDQLWKMKQLSFGTFLNASGQQRNFSPKPQAAERYASLKQEDRFGLRKLPLSKTSMNSHPSGIQA